jgi:hypothetical membrane protein
MTRWTDLQDLEPHAAHRRGDHDLTQVDSAALPLPSTARPGPSVAARLGVLGLAGFWLAVGLAGAATPGYSHVRENISALAALPAPHPAVMITGFLLLAAGTVATAGALRQRLVGRSATAAAALIGLAGCCLVGSAVFRLDCSPTLTACRTLEETGAVSGHHVLHNLVSLLSFVLIIAALFTLGRALRRSPGLSHLRWPTCVIALLGAAFVIGLVIGTYGKVEGLAQRMFVLGVYGWLVLLAVAPARRGADIGSA